MQNMMNHYTGEISGSHGQEYEDMSCGMLHSVLWYELTDVSKVLTA
jgi:hypothetical protein